jgi:F-type H+-transporting ATPase subunit c
MDFFTLCVIVAGFGMTVAVIPTSLSQSMAIKSALEGVARNPGASGKVLTTMLIGLAMIESLAIYVFVVAMIILFANPFTQHVLDLAAHAAK